MENGENAVTTLVGILLATLLGSVIGLERQWRQRFAGLRTNALVATGAAAFAVAAVSPLCMANPAPVLGAIVTGIGFLGAGVIFKEDFSVSGLNTAATLWCSAAVGTLSGMGLKAEAVALAALVVGINMVLRPLARYLAQSPANAASEMESTYGVSGLCTKRVEHGLRAYLLEEAGASKLRVRNLHSVAAHQGLMRISVELVVVGRDDKRIDDVTTLLSARPGVRSMRWQLDRSASHFE
ncbi:MAG TPA: MgtC/SapB family protein [Candidatus Saccharimonadales bacterium]|nr:MgtC/SapB family protein [Candidatus Saccharimonadales bacterium]